MSCHVIKTCSGHLGDVHSVINCFCIRLCVIVGVSIMIPSVECSVGVQLKGTATQEHEMVGGWMNWLPLRLTVDTEAHRMWVLGA